MQTLIRADVGTLAMSDDDDGKTTRFALGEDDGPTTMDPWVFRLDREGLALVIKHIVGDNRAIAITENEMSELRTENEILRAALSDANAKIGDLESRLAAWDASRTIDAQTHGAIPDLDDARDTPLTPEQEEVRDMRRRFGAVIQENAELINARLTAERERDEARAQLAELATSVNRGAHTREVASQSAQLAILRDFVPTHIVVVKNVRTSDGLRFAELATPLRNVTPTVAAVAAGKSEVGDRVYETADGSQIWSEKPAGIYYKGEHVGRALGRFVAAFGNRATVEIVPCDETGRPL